MTQKITSAVKITTLHKKEKLQQTSQKAEKNEVRPK
jgi:hypothetical protein